MKVTYKDVVIESTSTDEILQMLKTLQRSKEEVKVTVVKPTRSYYKKTNRGPRALWTEEEIEFLLKNLEQPAGYIRKVFPYKTHTRNAVSTMFYAIKSRDNKKFGSATKELMKKYNLI